MEQLQIKAINFSTDYKLNITLSNGHGIIFNFISIINTARFQQLKDVSLFKKGYLSNNGVICWSCGTELTLDEIMMELTNQMPYRMASN